MSEWNGTILGPPNVSLSPSVSTHMTDSNQSNFENRIYELKIHCGENYPDSPPEVQFKSEINLNISSTVISPTGVVEVKAINNLKEWRRDFTMETVLMEIRRHMADPNVKKLPQPKEGTKYEWAKGL